MHHRPFLLLTGILLGTPSAVALAQQPAAPPPQCRVAGSVVKIPELPEASGLAISRRESGRLWAHNDSGVPVLFAMNTSGAVTGRLRLSGADVDDWEALAVAACPAGSCIYVADIGDNSARRKRISVYRFTEPAATADSVAVGDVFHATYPDGPRDAESLLVTPDGRMHVVTKGDGGAALYRFPREPRSGSTVQLERVGAPRQSSRRRDNDRITDGAVSPDGERVVLRSNNALIFYRTAELLAGNWRESGRVDIGHLREPQGEGVAFGANGTVYLTGEGGGKSQPGTFARLTCVPAR
jgi:hypothetical protein